MDCTAGPEVGRRVLLVERFREQSEIAALLKGHGFQVQGVVGLTPAEIDRCVYDLVVMSEAVSGKDKDAYLRMIRAGPMRYVPTLMVAVSGEVGQTRQILRSKIDAMIATPFTATEFMIRAVGAIRTALEVDRRAPLLVDDLLLDPNTGEAHRGTRKLKLTAHGICILERLMQNTPNYVPTHELEKCVWKARAAPRGALQSRIYELRGQIDGPLERSLVQSKRFHGYRIA